MAEKISVQIALEGGAEIQRQLEGIGEAGQKAFAGIAKSAEQVGGFKNIKPEDVTQKLKDLGVTGVESIDKIQKAVQSAARLETLVQGISSVETALVALGRAAGPIGLALAAAFQAASKATIAFAETINKASDQAVKLGVSFAQFEQIRQELEKVGISGKGAAEGLAHFQKQLGEPRTDVVNVLTQTGQVLRFVSDTSNLAANRIQPFLDRLRQMPDTVERTNLAISQLGEKAGTQVIQGLRRAEGSMSADEAKAYDLERAITRLNDTWAKFGSVSLAPTLTSGINLTTDAIRGLGAELERNPWGTYGAAANAALNPLPALIQILGSAIANLASQLTGISWDTISSGATSAWNAVIGAVQSAGAAISEFGSSIGTITWDTISSGATSAWNAVTSAIQSAGSAISDFVSNLGTITWDAISSAGVSAWNAITSAIQSATDALLRFIGLKPQAPATGGGAPGAARGGLIFGRGSGTSDSNLAWLSRGEYVTPARVVRKPGVLAFLEALRRSGELPGFARGGLASDADIVTVSGTFIEGIDQVIRKLFGILPQLNTAMSALRDGLSQLYEQHSSAMAKVWDDIADAMVDLGEFSQKAASRAHGGLIGGRGTGTSDSNLAWVSRGEYITPARAVAQPGMLAFLEALRRSGGNLRGVLDGMGRFALGGLVPRPAFAGGSAVGNMSNVTINFPGLQPISGLRASDAVVDELRKAAALAQVRSGGRKPSRYS